MDDDDDIYGLMAEENQYRDVEEAIEVPAPGTARDDSDEENKRIVAPKVKKTLRPRLKLDADRLTGPRGLSLIKTTFDNIKFKGKGHELQDLSDVLARLQHWAHRLYPKLTFEDCITRIEELGSKKPVVSALGKLRMGDDDVVENIDDDEPVADPFDTLIPQVQPQTLTDEQRARMLKNRLIAEERRMAKMKEKLELVKKQNDNNEPQEDNFSVELNNETSETSLGEKINIETQENIDSSIEKCGIPLTVDFNEKNASQEIPPQIQDENTTQNLKNNTDIDVPFEENMEICDITQENSQICSKSQEKPVQNFYSKTDIVDESILNAFEENDFSLPEDFPF